ncbi:phytanoyl-CoA dioxygenase [Colletotrichum tofieldiae]|uniref:Phytanoyl-CoA dioxygenase n=1 Tax=Colletotrichum tofieldiae TaxID=708197 RepID=A0A166U4W9_9PEZI|nr:phytanoyl-CoA dioxygenase [Colletotrichum tofieldiae]
MAPSTPNEDTLASTPVDKEYYNRKAKPLPEDPTLRSYVENVLRDGYVIIPNAFTETEAVEAIAEIDRLHGKGPKTGSNFFDGYKTNRILSLLGKTRVFDKFCLLPQVHALNDYFLDEDYLFYIMETIVINPGEKNQVLHHDDAVTHLPRPRPPVTAATMIVLGDYTETNGATRIIPGSHLWGSDRVGEEHEAVSAVCPRGSVIYFLGTTWHSGGANRSQRPRYAATIQYCQPYIRPLENLMFGIDPRRVLSGEIPKRIADMMGYRSAIPFIGYVDGLNPRKAAKRLVRWLQAPVDLNPPTFAKEEGAKEAHLLSKL